MHDPAALLAELIRAHRSGDRATVDATLTRLRSLGVHIQFGDTLPARIQATSTAGVSASRPGR